MFSSEAQVPVASSTDVVARRRRRRANLRNDWDAGADRLTSGVGEVSGPEETSAVELNSLARRSHDSLWPPVRPVHMLAVCRRSSPLADVNWFAHLML